MKFILNKDKLEIENIELVNSGSISYYEVDVEYDESWNNLIIEAVMIKKDDDVGKSVAVINNKMYIDQKVKGTYYCIGFVGYKLEEEKKVYQISTNLEKVCFALGAGEIQTENEEVPTPTEWELYIAQINEIINGVSEEITNKVMSEIQPTLDKNLQEMKDYTDKEIASFDFIKVVDILPEEGLPNRIYFVPKADTQTQDLFDEYVWLNKGTVEEPNWVWEWVTTKQIEVDLTNYVKNTDYATRTGEPGVVRVSSTYGIAVGSSGFIFPALASETDIDSKESVYRVIVPANLVYAVESVVGGHVTLSQAEYDELVANGTVTTEDGITYTFNQKTFYYIKEE